MPNGTIGRTKPTYKVMKIYLLMVSRDHNQEQTAEFAYYSKEEAYRVRKMWNDTQEALDRKNAEEHGQSYEEWVGAWADYAFVEQVEILGEPINQ
jgi:hypothetical protein